MSKKHSHDLSVRGEPELVSLRKVLKGPLKNSEGNPFQVLIGEVPIRNNAKDMVKEMSVKDRKTQALYFIKNFPKVYPPYLMKWMKKAYETEDDELIKRFIDGAKNNKEAQQVIGLIQLFLGSLRLAKKHNSSARLYIIEPETHLHPKRERMIMYILNKIYEEEFGEQEARSGAKK